MPFQVSKRTVLSVDDDEVNQLVMCSFLEGAGYNVFQAMNGVDCLSYLEKAYSEEIGDKPVIPDAVLLDVMMPGMDGYEVCRQIRSRYPASLCVIMISAKMSREDVIYGLTTGLANDYLTKPFDRAILSAKLESRIKLTDAVKAIAAHDREEYCAAAYRPMFPLESPESPAAVISFSGSALSAQISDALSVVNTYASTGSVCVKAFQAGKCIITGSTCESVAELCTVLGQHDAVSACLCFILRGTSEALLGVTQPGPAVRATEEFFHRLKASDSSFAVSSDSSDPFRNLCVCIRGLSPVPPAVARETMGSPAPGRFKAPTDLEQVRRRLELLREVVRLESAVGELKGGLAFENANFDALTYRLEKANKFKADFAQKLGLVDDIPM